MNAPPWREGLGEGVGSSLIDTKAQVNRHPLPASPSKNVYQKSVCREGEAPAKPQVTKDSRFGRSLTLPSNPMPYFSHMF